MEASVLVVIDLNDAIAKGYARLTASLTEQKIDENVPDEDMYRP